MDWCVQNGEYPHTTHPTNLHPTCTDPRPLVPSLRPAKHVRLSWVWGAVATCKHCIYICVSQRHSSFLSFSWVMRWAGRADRPLLTLGTSWGKETYCWNGVEVTYSTFVLFVCNGRVEGREGWCGVWPPNTDVSLQLGLCNEWRENGQCS